MSEVWVLSDECPFDDPDGAGGCVRGVFATAAAALFELGTWEIGPEGLAEITWTQWREGAYEGHGHEDAIYILRRHVVQEEAALRAGYAAYGEAHGLRPHPYLALSTQDLLAMLNDVEQECEP